MFCSFTIVGDGLDPDEVTEVTGLDPLHAWRKGDPRVWRSGEVGPPRKTSAWIYEAPVEFSVDLPGLLSRLLDCVEPRRREILALMDRTGSTARVSLHIYMSYTTPNGYVTCATMKRIVALNADLELDLYVDDDANLRQRASGSYPPPETLDPNTTG